MKLKIATMNCENLFSRPKIFYAQDSSMLLGKVSQLTDALRQAVFNHASINKLANDLKGYAKVIDIKGTYKTAPGAADWLGWIELTRKRFEDAPIQNLARVIDVIDADLQCLCEVESRPVLCMFHDQVLWPDFLKKNGKRRFEYNLIIDANDDRGIDVAVMSRLPIISIKTHMFETTNYLGKETRLFSRDCLEISLEVAPGKIVVVLVNHLKSMGYNPPADPNSDNRRLGQARRVAEIADTYLLDQENLVIAGDLNSPPESPSLAPLVNHPKLYNVNLQLPVSDRGTYRTGTQQLDYLFVSSALHACLQNVYIERRGVFAKTKWKPFDQVISRSTAASDHSAVVAEFDI